MPDNETRDRILSAAETLFSTKGFAGVRLRDIAEAVGLRHASLYYYAPGGKEQLFVEVMERNLNRHRTGMAQAIVEAGSLLRDQMQAVARWLLSQPPLDFARIFNVDMPAIESREARRLSFLAYDTLRQPLADAILVAANGGVIAIVDADMAAMTFVSLIETIHNLPLDLMGGERTRVIEDLIDMLLNGWLTR